MEKISQVDKIANAEDAQKEQVTVSILNTVQYGSEHSDGSDTSSDMTHCHVK